MTINTITSGASIRYTTNGTTPTSTTGTLYSGAITVSSTTTLKAIAYKSGMTDSSVATAVFTISADGLTTIAGPHLGTAYDTMGRPSTLTDLATSAAIISGTTYGPANQLLTMSGQVNETRTYNSMLQLTSLTSSNTSGGAVNITYAYSATQNNGKITSQTDSISGEQVVYTYDALNRLATAQATSNSWGQSYAYDGFGNLTDQNVTAGSAPALHVVYNAATNRQTADCADANGNLGSASACGGAATNYDVENRMISPNTANQWQYSCAPGNKRVWRGVWTSGTLTTDEVTFWGVDGQKLGTWQLSWYTGSSPAQLYGTMTGCNYYFGGKLIKNVGGYVSADRLGSIGKFYPYGQERPSATTNGTEKFTGYLRDAETGLDYADQRYEQPGVGRFMTPDAYGGSGATRDPKSWNRYAYTRGDPINSVDPSGTVDCLPGVAYCYSMTVSAGGLDPLTYNMVSSISTSLATFLDPWYMAQVKAAYQRVIDQAARLKADAQSAKDAVDRASDRIAGEDCTSLFLGSNYNTPDSRVALSQAFQTYGQNNVRVLPQGTPGTDPSVPGFTTDTLGYTYFNQGGSFFTGTTGDGKALGGAFAGLNTIKFKSSC